MSPFLLCHCVAVPGRCRSGCVVRYASVTLRCVAVAFRLRYASVTLRGGCVSCIVLRGGCVAVALRGGCVSLCFGPLRFVPGGLVPFRVVVPCRAGPLGTRSVLRRAQNRHFCALFGLGTPIFRPFEHKIGVLCQNGRFFRDFWSF